MFGLAAFATLLAGCQPSDSRTGLTPRQNIKALDGDTLIFEGRLVRLRGVDAPELGPWAKCWAEAALGGVSRTELEGKLNLRDGRWRLSDASPPDAQGRITANLVNDRGGDLSDAMVVDGYAARTDTAWNWCGTDQKLHDPLQGEPAPHGPSLWWPAGEMLDNRAAD